MSILILDASVAASWLFSDETEPRVDATLARLAEDGAYVPQLWHLEVRNVLLVAERRGRISTGQQREFLDALSELPIRTDYNTGPRARFRACSHPWPLILRCDLP